MTNHHHDTPYDALPVLDATLADIDVRTFEEDYLPNALDPELLAANNRTTEDCLAATRMIASVENPVPTVVGMLAFGRDPQYFIPGAYIQFLQMAGTEFPGPILDEARCTGTVAAQLDRLFGKFDSHNRTAVDITSGPVEQRRFKQSAVALRQIAFNAVMHRTYEATNAPVRVTWYDDRVEVLSPGGAYGAVTADNFGQPGVADYRNPNLAKTMRLLGLVQRFVGGIGIARAALRRNAQPEPIFDVQPEWVRCILTARANYTEGVQ